MHDNWYVRNKVVIVSEQRLTLTPGEPIPWWRVDNRIRNRWRRWRA